MIEVKFSDRPTYCIVYLLQTRAVLDSSQTIAASQQLAAFAVLVGGEGVWAMQRMREEPGRPGVLPTAVGAGGLLAVCTTTIFHRETAPRLDVMGSD